MTDGRRTIAAKIYKDFEDVDDPPGRPKPIDKAARSRKELGAYKQLRQTPLGIYLPEPYFLLHDDASQVVGLGIQWIEGETLDDLYFDDKSRLLQPEELDELHRRLEATRGEGLYINGDMLSSFNLIRGEQGLFFAECEIDDSRDPDTLKQTFLENCFTVLNDNYKATN